ncbi:MAG TPA: hypothetical protein VH561_00855 [Micromonosporaceae bacterium]
MDGVTLFAAGLIGAGVAVLAVVVAAVAKRRARATVRRRDPGPRTVPGPRPASARPGAPARSGPTAPPAVRTNDARSRTGGPRGGFRPPVAALGGETLQLGPVPAWKLPVRARNAAGAPPTPPAQAKPGRTSAEYTSVAALAGLAEEQVAPDPAEGAGARTAAEPRGGPSVATNASRRHDRPTAAGRGSPAR